MTHGVGPFVHEREDFGIFVVLLVRVGGHKAFVFGVRISISKLHIMLRTISSGSQDLPDLRLLSVLEWN